MGLKTRKTGPCCEHSRNCAVCNSLKTIKEAHGRLHLLNGTCTTAAAVASQIELFDVLLGEITDIQTQLARDILHARVTPQASGLNA
jgi:hypothetical protein